VASAMCATVQARTMSTTSLRQSTTAVRMTATSLLSVVPAMHARLRPRRTQPILWRAVASVSLSGIRVTCRDGAYVRPL